VSEIGKSVGIEKVLQESWKEFKSWIKQLKIAATLIATIIVLAEFGIGFFMVQEPITHFDNNSELATTDCTALVEHEYKVLIGTGSGAFIYDPLEEIEKPIVNVLNETHVSDGSIYTIRVKDATYQNQFGLYVLTQDIQGGVYRVSTDYVPRFVNVTGGIPTFDGYFTNIAASQAEPLIILASTGNNLYIYNQSAYNYSLSRSCNLLGTVNDLFCIEYEVIVAGDKGLSIYDILNDSFFEFQIYASSDIVRIKAIEYDALSALLYLGTSHGLYVFQRMGYNLTLIKRYNEADGIVTGSITCLELDMTTDTLFVGTKFGLSVIDLRSETLLRNYNGIFPTRFQDIKDILLYRAGSVRRLMVSSGLGGFASIRIHNLPTLPEFVNSHLSGLFSFIAIPFGIIALYLNQQKKFPKEFIYYYILILFFFIMSWWIIQLQSLLSIPQVRPELVSTFR